MKLALIIFSIFWSQLSFSQADDKKWTCVCTDIDPGLFNYRCSQSASIFRRRGELLVGNFTTDISAQKDGKNLGRSGNLAKNCVAGSIKCYTTLPKDDEPGKFCLQRGYWAKPAIDEPADSSSETQPTEPGLPEKKGLLSK
jgi:hypothetical protein